MPHQGVKISQRGFTLSEVLIAAAIFAIIGTGIIGTISLFLKYSQSSKDKIQAQNIAEQKIEIIRNMPYDSVATQFGAIYPPGNLLDSENITIDKTLFKVYTSISYVDDPFDGNAAGTVVGKPQDLYPYDYKKITITVKDRNDNFITETTTNMAAKAAETASNTGILSLKVQDSNGNPVEGAIVTVTNPTPSPPVNISTFTDNSGLVLIPSLPPSSSNNYHVRVSLSGYSSDGTNPSFAPNNLYPVQPDFNIIAQQITSLTLEIAPVGTLKVNVKDTTGASLSGLSVNVKGDKLTYTTPDTYKFNQNFTTDGAGTFTVTNVEWDSYSLTPPSGYYVVSTSPYQKLSVDAGANEEVTLVLTNSTSYPRLTAMSPEEGTNDSTVDFVITGANLVTGTSVKLVMVGQSDIVATGVVSANGDTELDGTFDLTSKQVGVWDLIVTDPTSNVITQVGGFKIGAP